MGLIDLDRPASTGDDRMQCLRELERKVLWLSSWMIHNANHVRPVPRGQKVRAIAKPLHLGRQTHVWEVRVETEDKKLVCIARLTTAIHPRKSNGLG